METRIRLLPWSPCSSLKTPIAKQQPPTALKKSIDDWLMMPRFSGWARPATEVAPDTAKSAFADSPRGSTGMACFSSSGVAPQGIVAAIKRRPSLRLP